MICWGKCWLVKNIRANHCSSAHKCLPHLLAGSLIYCLAACNLIKKRKKEIERKKTRWLENVSRLKTKCFGWWSTWWRVSNKGKVASYLASFGPLKAFRCSAPLSGSSRAKIELLFLFLAADERTESDPDSWDYIGIWVTHYCHPQHVPPAQTEHLATLCFLWEQHWQNRWVSASAPYD